MTIRKTLGRGRHRPVEPRLLGGAVVAARGGLRHAARRAPHRLLRGARDRGRDHVPFPRGPGYYAITRYADVVEMSRHPELFCSGQSATIIFDMPPGAPRVLRLDDQHGRPPPRPAAADRVGRLQPAHGARHRGQHPAGGRRPHRHGAGQGRVRLRHRGRGPAAAEGHLRHDGRARERLRHRLQPAPTSSCPSATPSTSPRARTPCWPS